MTKRKRDTDISVAVSEVDDLTRKVQKVLGLSVSQDKQLQCHQDLKRSNRFSQYIRKKRPSTMARKSAKSGSRLLELPAELRNQVYRHALLGPNDILVDRTHYTQPAILRVCRMIRSEASSIFYEENEFEIVIYDLRLAPSLEHWFWTHVSDIKEFEFKFVGSDSWKNFKDWLHQFYMNESRPFPAPMEPKAEDKSIVPIYEGFTLVETLMKAGNSWEVISSVLETYKKATQAVSDGNDGNGVFWDD